MSEISKTLDDAARWLEGATREVDLAKASYEYENSRNAALGRVAAALHLITSAQRMLNEVADKLAPTPDVNRKDH